MVFVLLKLQYVEKSETALNLRLNNHRFDVFGRNALPTCHHFAQGKHRFDEHAKFKMIKRIPKAIN